MGTKPLAFGFGPWAVALRGQQQIRENKAPGSEAGRWAASVSAPKEAAAPWGVKVWTDHLKDSSLGDGNRTRRNICVH